MNSNIEANISTNPSVLKLSKQISPRHRTSSAPIKVERNRRAVQSFRSHVANVKSVDMSEIMQSNFTSSPTTTTTTTPTTTTILLTKDRTFLLQELQRIRLELVTKEEQLQTAAVLGEQLIAYNEELEETHRQMSNTNNTQNLKDTCSFDRRNEPSLSIDLPTHTFSTIYSTVQNERTTNVPNEEEERLTNVTLKKRLANVSHHLHEAEISNATLHNKVLKLELVQQQQQKQQQENDDNINDNDARSASTPSPPFSSVAHVRNVALLEKQIQENALQYQSNMEQQIQKNEKLELQNTKINQTFQTLTFKNEELTNQINTVQFESHTTENRATVAENEAFKWETTASRYQEELQEIKELLSSTRPIKRDSIFGFDRRASLHDGKGRGHRLASSLSNVVGLDEIMEERIILCSDANNRFARPKTNKDPYIEFTDLRKLIEVFK